MTTQDAIDRAAHRLMRLRNPHRDLAQALRELAETKRADEWIHSLPVVSIDEWAVQHAPDLIAEAEERTGVLHWTTRQRLEGEPDSIDRAMARSVRYFENPLNTPARRRLAGATLRRNCPA